MSYILCRDGEAKDYCFGGQWSLLLRTMERFGWIPKGTQYFITPDAVGFQYGAGKNAVYCVDMDELYDRTTPEELAEHATGWNGQNYEELLAVYSAQWGGVDPIDIPSRRNPDWRGSYTSNDGQYVVAEDALAMSAALERAAEELDRSGAIGLPEDRAGLACKVAASIYRLEDKDRTNQNPRVLEGAEALRTFASWLSKGEFRIY